MWDNERGKSVVAEERERKRKKTSSVARHRRRRGREGALLQRRCADADVDADTAAGSRLDRMHHRRTTSATSHLLQETAHCRRSYVGFCGEGGPAQALEGAGGPLKVASSAVVE
ncbi:hypothetical protein M758_7G172300 [Ceratodon purpureus]|nr:hypothetical protein M758_7G172300 [Ceratodon purpureus]